MNSQKILTVEILQSFRGNKFFQVSDLKEAQQLVIEKRGNKPSSRYGGGNVFDKENKQIAHISYNGRIWEPGPFPQKEIIL